VFGRSARFRLLAASAVVIIFAVQVAGAVIIVIFERHLVRTADHDLDALLDQLASMLVLNPDGHPAMASELADPRFRQPFSGRYWQISTKGAAVLRSRSLWDVELPIANPPAPGAGISRAELLGPEGLAVRVAVMTITIGDESQNQGTHYVLASAINRSEIERLGSSFASDVLGAVAVLGFLLIASAWAQVTVGLAPFEGLRKDLEAIRIGNSQRLNTEELVTEVQPLARETNRLLEVQDLAIAAARKRAGDLAHGLKTPLTALAMVAEQLRRSDQAEVAEEIELQIRGIGQHVERELALARIAARARAQKRACIEPVVAGVVRTMRKLPRGSDIAWHIDCPPELATAVDEVDLAEILGNLLDNARKWSRSKVRVSARSNGNVVELHTEDDGPGFSPQDHARVLQRGGRLDESIPGSGLGLAITKEIIEAYQGSMQFHESRLGGLHVEITLPVPS
jgi:signal transduction histidine kinase